MRFTAPVLLCYFSVILKYTPRVFAEKLTPFEDDTVALQSSRNQSLLLSIPNVNFDLTSSG